MSVDAPRELSAFLEREQAAVLRRWRAEVRARAGDLDAEMEGLVAELARVLRERPDEAAALFSAMAVERVTHRSELGLRAAVRELNALEVAVLERWARTHRGGDVPAAVAQLLAGVVGEAIADVARAVAQTGAEPPAVTRSREAELKRALTERDAELDRTDRELASLHARLLRLGHDRSLGDIAAGTALALNNELNALGLGLRLLREGGPAEIPRHLEALSQAVQRAAQLVSRLQDLSARRSQGPSRAVDLNVAVMEALDLVRPELTAAAARHKSVRVDARLGSGGRVWVHGGELREVLCKLLVAARDEMPAGGVLQIATHLHHDRGEVALSHPAAPGPSDDETRLALEVARELAQRWHGEVHGETGRGRRTVRLTLPLAGEAEAAPIPGPAVVGSGARHVLVVDDDAGNRETLTELLGLAGHDVDDATSSEQALDQAGRRDYDAALVDLAMPGMNGLELARRLRAHDPAMRIALVTGWGMEDTGADPAVVDVVFRKPIDLPAILAFLARGHTREHPEPH